MLQRRLSIGYGRAAKILDMLEEAGVIGPANGSKPREVLISREQYEAQMEGGISGVSLHNRAEAKAPDNYFGSDEGDDGTLVFKGDKEESEEEIKEDDENDEEAIIAESTEDAPEELDEELGEIEDELLVTPEEEEEIIEDEDEILEEIRETKEKKELEVKGNSEKKEKTPFIDDDEMFFSK
jgi:hypothetical protein